MVNTSQPLVSVLMTCYNREDFIGEAIQSVLDSSYKNFELIIVDDCSKDNTVQIARSYALQDDRIQVHINEINLKDYPNRNRAASYAKGKYLKFVDSDDLIYPWGLEAMVYCMESFPDAAYGLISYGIPSGIRFPFVLSPVEAYSAFFFKGSMIITGPTGAIFKREVFESLNGFSGKPYLGDTEMWLKFSKKYALVGMPLDIVWWRQHESQQFKEGNEYTETNTYNMYLQSLLDNDCPFPEDQRLMAVRNLKNRYARNLIRLFLKGKIAYALKLKTSYGLTLSDFIKSLKPNRYPVLN